MGNNFYSYDVLISYSELGATLQPDVLHSPFKSKGTEPSRFHRVALAGSMATIEIPVSPHAGPGKSSVLHFLQPLSIQNRHWRVTRFIIQKHNLCVTEWVCFFPRGRIEQLQYKKKKKNVPLYRSMAHPYSLNRIGSIHSSSFIRRRCWKQAFYTWDTKEPLWNTGWKRYTL